MQSEAKDKVRRPPLLQKDNFKPQKIMLTVKCEKLLKKAFVSGNKIIVELLITHNMRILFHEAHLYKSIRFIFTCGKGLYSQSEWRTAISHVEV